MRGIKALGVIAVVVFVVSLVGGCGGDGGGVVSDGAVIEEMVLDSSLEVSATPPVTPLNELENAEKTNIDVENPAESVPEMPVVNEGITSANVRLYFVDVGDIRQWYPEYRIFDLSYIEHYHEFVNTNGSFQIIFTTENTVRDFMFLDVKFNDNFGDNEYENFYLVQSVLYHLNELTSEAPLVVSGANLGCALASNGFSFVAEDGVTRHFAFLQDGSTGLIVISEF